MTLGWTVHEVGDGPVEVVIGMRWRALWRLATRPWVPVAFARMVFDGRSNGRRRTRFAVSAAGPVVVQQWESRGAVDAWARDRARTHAAPWSRFARDAGPTAGWGLWHEISPLPPIEKVAYATSSC